MKKLLALSFIIVSFVSCNRNRIGYVASEVDPTNTYDNRSVGLSANDFLALARYKAINMEICYVEQHQLPDTVINSAVSFLAKYCHKPGGITVKQRKLPIQGGKLQVNDLINIEKIYRTQFERKGKNNADTLALYILVTESDFHENGILGVAYKNTSIAIFDGIITDNSGGAGKPGRNTLLSTVLHHELGHILGLVNMGTDLQRGHEDAAHSKHCSNKDCLMYYKMQTTDVLSVLTGDVVPVLDADCEYDLRANGAR